MGWKKVTDDGPPGGGGNFKSFKEIGNKFLGRVIRRQFALSNFPGEEQKQITEYVFKDKDGEFVIGPLPKNLQSKFDKVERDKELFVGTACKMEFTSTVPTGQASPMKVIDLDINNDGVPANPLPPATWPAGKGPGAGAAGNKPPPMDDEDIPF